MLKVGIFGCSGFAREVADIAFQLGYDPVLIARAKSELEDWNFPYNIMLESELEIDSEMVFSIGIGDNATREKVVKQFSKNLKFINLVHPSASFGRAQEDIVAKQKGVIICAGVRFTNNIRVGDFTIFNLNSTIGHDVIIEDFVNISPGANISGNVHLEVGCLIGTGAAIKQGQFEEKLKIGSNTIIGAGSLVVKPCERDSVYFGVPVRKKV